MKRRKSLCKALLLAPLALCCSLGCGDDGNFLFGGQESVEQILQRNEQTVESVLDQMETMLDAGVDVESIRQAAVETFLQNGRVIGAAVDPHSDSVWVMFRNGERQVLVIDDEPTVADDPAAAAVGPPKPRLAEALKAIPNLKPAAPQQATGAGGSVMPGSTRAFLGNSLTAFHKDQRGWVVWDSTELIEKMLRARGYEPVREELKLEHFTHLSDYGLIVLETHGGWGGPESVLQAIEFPKELGIKEDPSIACGGRAGQFHILTTTPFTQEAIDKFWGKGREGLYKYLTDIVRQRAGKTARISRTIRGPDGRLRRTKTFWVSAHFIRAHDQGTFPDNTFLFLNACVGYDGDLAPLKDVLFEKTKRGAHFLGWDDETLARIAVRAGLNLFQIMTHSNEEKIANGFKALEKASPPRGKLFSSLNAVLGELSLQGFDRYESRGRIIGRLRLVQQNPGGGDLILMPYLMDFTPKWQPDGADYIALVSEGQPEVRIGGAKVTLLNQTSIQSWDASVPVGAYGDIVIEEKGRKSPPVPLHRWKMQIRISRNAGDNGGMSYDVIFTLHGRATVIGYRDSVWNDAPTPVFRVLWDPEASFVSWTISGEETVARWHHKYQGGGGPIHLTHTPGAGTGQLRVNQTGNQVSVVAAGLVTYTQTTTDLLTQEVTIETHTEGVLLNRTMDLIWDWAILAAEYTTTDCGLDGTATVRWSEVPAEPPFDPDEAAR